MGDTIDSIKYFDLEDQISNTFVDSVKIYPYTEFLIDGKIGDNIIRKQKYLLNYSDSVSGLWDYVSDSVIFIMIIIRLLIVILYLEIIY